MASITDQLVHSTVRLECTDLVGGKSSGTAFFYSFCDNGAGTTVPALVTNKHVIDGAVLGSFYLHITGPDGEPEYGKQFPVTIRDFQRHWVPHPENEVDLAALPLASIVTAMNSAGKKPYLRSVNRAFTMQGEELKKLSAIEDVLMIGYPIGLWDNVNNWPIARRGVTATPPYVDFQGKAEFMIDCACFPGSSGSPVFLANLGSYQNKTDGGTVIGNRIKLLGVLWGGPQHTAAGKIVAVPVPTKTEPVSLSLIPTNLGFCIKAEKLEAFEAIFAKALEQEMATKLGPSSTPPTLSPEN